MSGANASHYLRGRLGNLNFKNVDSELVVAAWNPEGNVFWCRVCVSLLGPAEVWSQKIAQLVAPVNRRAGAGGTIPFEPPRHAFSFRSNP